MKKLINGKGEFIRKLIKIDLLKKIKAKKLLKMIEKNYVIENTILLADKRKYLY